MFSAIMRRIGVSGIRSSSAPGPTAGSGGFLPLCRVDVILDVLAGHATAYARAGDFRQVNAVLLGQTLDRRRVPWSAAGSSNVILGRRDGATRAGRAYWRHVPSAALRSCL